MSGSDADRQQPEPDDGHFWLWLGFLLLMGTAGWIVYEVFN